MNGPEHYRAAERLLGIAMESSNAPNAVAQILAEAQVHATLALGAAAAMRGDGYTPAVWSKVMGS